MQCTVDALHYEGEILQNDEDLTSKKNYIKQSTINELKNYIGNENSFSAQDILAKLASEDKKNTGQKLLERTLFICSFDLLEKDSVSKVDYTKFADKLHLAEKGIMPHTVVGGAADFFGGALYKSKDRVVRIHIYPDNPSGEHAQDNFVHSHAYNIGSLILCGALANTLFTPKRRPDGEEFLHQVVYREGASMLENTGIGVDSQFISHRTYRSGQHYSFTTGNTHKEIDRPEKPSRGAYYDAVAHPGNRAYYHRVSTPGDEPTITFFEFRQAGESCETAYVVKDDSPQAQTQNFKPRKLTTDMTAAVMSAAEECLRRHSEGRVHSLMHLSGSFSR